MDKETSLTKEYKRYFLMCLCLLFILNLLNFVLYNEVSVMRYFLLSVFLLIVVAVSVVCFIPSYYSLRLLPTFVILLMVFLIFPLTSLLLSQGNCTSLFWYLVIVVFLHSVYRGKAFLWWVGAMGCLLLLSFVFAFVLRYVWLNDVPISLSVSVSLYDWLTPTMLNISFAFLFTALSAYYSQRFYQGKIDALQSVLHLEKQKEKKELAAIDLKIEHKYVLIYERIEAYFEDTQPYLNRKFKLGKMASDLNINTLYLSKAIRNNSGMSFNQYVNRYRIGHTKKLMQSNNRKYTLEYIFLASGFANQPSFNKVFKQLEGVTPSEYLNSKRGV